MKCPICSIDLVPVGHFNVCSQHGVSAFTSSLESLIDQQEGNKRYGSASVEQPFRMLIVDDEPMILASLSYAFADHFKDAPQGGHVDTCSSGDQALTLLAEHEYDFLLTDVLMPGISGSEVLRQAHAKYPKLWYGVMSGFSDLEDYISAVKIGALFYLQKPFGHSDLVPLLGRIAQLRRAINKKMMDGFLPVSEKDTIFTVVPELVRMAGMLWMSKDLRTYSETKPSVDPQKLFPYIMGGLLHNAMNAVMGLSSAIQLSSVQTSRAQDAAEKRTVPSLVPALEQLEVILQLMQGLARGIYAQPQGTMPSAQLARIVEGTVLSNPNVRYDFEIDPAVDQLPLPIGVSEFIAGELIKNATTACHGSEGASVSLNVSVDRSRDTISFECKNSGNGFSVEMLEKIRGQRLRAPEQKKAGGYGLYLIQELALRLHGSLLVSNLDPSGARVQVLLTTKVKDQ